MLPPEIRLAIYDELFSSTTLVFNDAKNTDGPLEESHHPLSILYTCWTVYLEARDRWQDKVLYHFEGPQTMLEVLARKTKDFSTGSYHGLCAPLLRSSL